MKVHILWAQHPDTKEWVSLFLKTSTTNVQNRREGQQAVANAEVTHPGWQLKWQVTET